MLLSGLYSIAILFYFYGKNFPDSANEIPLRWFLCPLTCSYHSLRTSLFSDTIAYSRLILNFPCSSLREYYLETKISGSGLFISIGISLFSGSLSEHRSREYLYVCVCTQTCTHICYISRFIYALGLMSPPLYLQFLLTTRFILFFTLSVFVILWFPLSLIYVFNKALSI